VNESKKRIADGHFQTQLARRKRSKHLESFGHAKSGAGCDHSPQEEVLLGHIQHLAAKKEKNEPINVSQKERGESGLASTIRQHVVRFHLSQIKSLPFDRILVLILMAAFSM